MNTERAKDINAIVNKLKERARACPWVPLDLPPREHFHVFPNGLSICFTLDDLPGVQYWHLSIARVPGGVAPEEIDLWRRAFFAEEPDIKLPSPVPAASGNSFYWMVNDGLN